MVVLDKARKQQVVLWIPGQARNGVRCGAVSGDRFEICPLTLLGSVVVSGKC